MGVILNIVIMYRANRYVPCLRCPLQNGSKKYLYCWCQCFKDFSIKDYEKYLGTSRIMYVDAHNIKYRSELTVSPYFCHSGEMLEAIKYVTC